MAVVDLIRGWPQPGTTLIGLSSRCIPKTKATAVGRAVHDATLAWLRRSWPETSTLRAVIFTTNATHASPSWGALVADYKGTGFPTRVST